MTWRSTALAREALANVVASGLRSAVAAGIVAALTGLLAYLELREANGIAAFQRDFEAGGGYSAVVSGVGGTVDAARCEGLGAWPGVLAAGAVASTGTVSFTSAPGVLFQSARVTPGALRAWAPGMGAPPGGGYVVGNALAAEAGLRRGSYVALEGGPPLTVLAVLDPGRRNPAVTRWLLDISPPAFAAEQCWVVFTRAMYEPGVAALPAWFAAGQGERVVRPYLRRDAFTRDVTREFATRPQRYGWLAVAGLITALLILASWFRRAELGLYLALGTGRAQLVTLLTFEAGILVAAGTAAGTLWALAAERLLDHPLPWDHAWLAVRAAASGALLSAVLAPLLSQLVARGNLQSLLKDR